jgi:hypothetical protein
MSASEDERGETVTDDASWSGSRIRPASDGWSDIGLVGLRDLGAAARAEDSSRYDEVLQDVAEAMDDLISEPLDDGSPGAFAWDAAPAGLLGFAGRTDWKPTEWVACLLVENDLRRSFVIDLTAARPLRLALIADRLQDVVIEEFQAARPACPLHGHPLNAAVAGERAEWQCPDDASLWSCEIGGYRAVMRK